MGQKLWCDNETRRSGVLHINYDYMKFFDVHLYISTHVFFAFRSHKNAAAIAESWTLPQG